MLEFNTMKREVLFILALLCFLSCQETPLERALSLAGGNAPELQAVLDHYGEDEADSLKLRAAIFLIENMPGHYALGGPWVERYYEGVDSLLVCEKDRNRLQEKIDSLAASCHLPDSAVRLDDVEHITAAYLIHNIDRAFELWPSGGYAGHLSFAEFCEYVLPYRVGHEPLEYWRDTLAEKYNYIHEHGYFEGWRNSAFHACCEVNNRLRDEASAWLLPLQVPVEKYTVLNRLPIGDCDSYGARTVFAMRGKGIPVTIDFTPQWPYRDMGHSWNVLLDNGGQELPFSGADANPDVAHKPGAKLAKVYRRTFSRSGEALADICGNEPIPASLENPFFKDVTARYLRTSDVEVELAAIPEEERRVLYLSVFNNKEWIPVCYAPAKGRKVLFRALGRDIVYLPSYYLYGSMRPASYPFLLDIHGNVHYYEPDTADTYTLRVWRKYPLQFRVAGVTSHMVGGFFQAADNPEFRHAVTLHRIEENPLGRYVTVGLDTVQGRYRYWRHVSPVGGHGNIAEVQFFGGDGTLLNGQGTVIGTEGSWGNDPKRARESAFDGDPLTFFDSSQPDSAWVGMAFPEPVSVKKIVYLPRNDGNNIEPGDEYELFYYSLKGWQSLGRQKASGFCLDFEGVPQNALLWLHDHTKGKEERIFTFDGKDIYWW